MSAPDELLDRWSRDLTSQPTAEEWAAKKLRAHGMDVETAAHVAKWMQSHFAPAPTPEREADSRPRTVRCSFCGKARDSVAKMAKGAGGVLICNECVRACLDLFTARQPEASPTRDDMP